jgi:hypothetical protein
MKKQKDIIENGKITCKKKNDIEDEDLASKKMMIGGDWKNFKLEGKIFLRYDILLSRIM